MTTIDTDIDKEEKDDTEETDEKEETEEKEEEKHTDDLINQSLTKISNVASLGEALNECVYAVSLKYKSKDYCKIVTAEEFNSARIQELKSSGFMMYTAHRKAIAITDSQKIIEKYLSDCKYTDMDINVYTSLNYYIHYTTKAKQLVLAIILYDVNMGIQKELVDGYGSLNLYDITNKNDIVLLIKDLKLEKAKQIWTYRGKTIIYNCDMQNITDIKISTTQTLDDRAMGVKSDLMFSVFNCRTNKNAMTDILLKSVCSTAADAGKVVMNIYDLGKVRLKLMLGKIFDIVIDTLAAGSLMDYRYMGMTPYMREFGNTLNYSDDGLSWDDITEASIKQWLKTTNNQIKVYNIDILGCGIKEYIELSHLISIEIVNKLDIETTGDVSTNFPYGKMVRVNTGYIPDIRNIRKTAMREFEGCTIDGIDISDKIRN